MSDPFQNMIPNIQIPLCLIHNLPGLVINPDKNDKQTLVFCVNCLTKLKKVEDQIKENQKIFQDIQNENKRKIDILNRYMQSIHQFSNKITQSLKKIITSFKVFIDQIKLNQTEYNDLLVQSKFIEIDTIIERNNSQNQQFQEINKQITKQLKIIKQTFNTDNLIQDQQSDQKIQNLKEDKKNYQYSQVINSIQQNDKCCAIAINQNNSIVAVGNNNKIKIFQFQNEKLQEIQELDNLHTQNITCLTFMKKSEQLVSSCNGGKMIIWKLSNNKLWQQIQILNQHKNGIICLQINKNEDLIISGGEDQTIKFWKLDQGQWKCNQTLQMERKVYSLSLNESNDKLISTFHDQMQIKVIEKAGSQWIIKQTIKILKNTPRLLFINDYQFAVQLFQSELLQIFNFDQKSNSYVLGQEIKVKYGESDYNLFPMQYIKSNSILIDKNCQYINILKKQQNGEFNLIQTIDFGHRDLQGCLNDDGQYLFTWDCISKQLQVRKLEMI